MEPFSNGLKAFREISYPDIEDLWSLRTREPKTCRSRIRALCIIRWRCLVYMRRMFVNTQDPPAKLDHSIARAYDSETWSEIDELIMLHYLFKSYSIGTRIPMREILMLRRTVIMGLFTPEILSVCKECMKEWAEMGEMKKMMMGLKIDITYIEHEMMTCFEVLKSLLMPLEIV